MTNYIVRDSLKRNKVYQWQLAEALGISEVKLSRMFRHELPPKKQFELVDVIIKIAEEREKNGE